MSGQGHGVRDVGRGDAERLRDPGAAHPSAQQPESRPRDDDLTGTQHACTDCQCCRGGFVGPEDAPRPCPTCRPATAAHVARHRLARDQDAVPPPAWFTSADWRRRQAPTATAAEQPRASA